MTSLITLWAGALVAAGPVTGVSITSELERTQVTIAVEGEVVVRPPFTLVNPHRLVLDLVGGRHALPGGDFPGVYRGGVISVRTSQFATDVVRIILELEEPVGFAVATVPGSVVLSLENHSGPFEPWLVGEGRPASAFSGPATPAVSEPAAGDGMSAGPFVPVAQQVAPISVNFRNTPIQDVLLAFAEHSGRSIVPGGRVQQVPPITAEVRDQPWDIALRSILRTNGLVADETPEGIIEVHLASDVSARETGDPLETRAYRINYAPVSEIASAVQTILSERGTSSPSLGTNTLVVTDIPRVHLAVASLVQQLDIQTAQVTIQARIIFVSRTDLNEFGITYDLKDSGGNQLNLITPGAMDMNADGVIQLPEEQVDVGTNVVALGGNSVAALGNATSRVAGPTLTLLSSLLIGRHTLISFIEALESSNLSEIQAEPLVRVMDNQTARIVVGERTPIRVIDASAGGAVPGVGGGLPVAAVEIQETGIILEATPHVTAGDMIWLDLLAERSAPQLAATDAGVAFTTQNATTRVLVRDGETVVIGGLTVTETTDIRSGIPLLMDLPVIGRLFRVTRRANGQRDLIILVTPHIVRNGTN